MNQILGYFLITFIAIVPGITAYFYAKNFFKFPKKSVHQYAMIFAALFLVFIPIPIQSEILDLFGVEIKNDYLRKLTLVQYLIALVVLFWKIIDVEKKRKL